MSKHRYYNTTDTPYTMDAAGHVLGGRESGAFDSSSQIARGLAAGKLIHRGEVEEEKQSEDGGNQEAPSPVETPDENDQNSSDQPDKAQLIEPPSPEPKKKTSAPRRGRTSSEEESS